MFFFDFYNGLRDWVYMNIFEVLLSIMKIYVFKIMFIFNWVWFC